MPETSQPQPPAEPDGPDLRILVSIGLLLFIAGAVVGAMLYSFGIAHRSFDITMLRGGLMTFGVVTLFCVAGVVVMTVLIQILGILWPRSLSIWSEHRLLRRARNRTMALLKRRHRMQEERARLTARLQATYLLEKEAASVANQKALQELRSALQVSAVRSCEIVMEHLNRTMDEYQTLLAEIEDSGLDAVTKKELLNLLHSRLNPDVAEQRRASARNQMENAIWDVRLEKARQLAQRSRPTAVSYLERLRQKTDSHRVLLKIDSLLRELQVSDA